MVWEKYRNATDRFVVVGYACIFNEEVKDTRKHVNTHTYANVLCCRVKTNCPHVGPGPFGGVPSMEGLSKGS